MTPAPDRLAAATLAYLLLPYVIFFLGWLRPEFGVPLCAAVLAGWAAVARARVTASGPSPAALAVAGAVALGWTALSGAGGVGRISGDHLKHFAVIRDLACRPWPVALWGVRPADGPAVVFEGGADGDARLAAAGPGAKPEAFCLSYCLGYYLPTGLAGKWFGDAAAYAAMFAWTWAGAWLTLAWVARLVPAAPVAAACAFPLLSGLDYVGHAWATATGPPPHSHPEWWAGYPVWQYSSNCTLLFWTPQHGLAGWLVTAAVLARALEAGPATGLLLWAGACALWSPFATLGLVPFAAWELARRRGAGLSVAADLVAAPLLLGACALFYLGHAGATPGGLNWPAAGVAGHLRRMAIFDLLEFGLFAACAALLARDDRARACGWGPVALAVLVALPFVRGGGTNDLMMRGSVPALFVLWVLVLRRLAGPVTCVRHHAARAALAGLLLAGAAWPALDMRGAWLTWRVARPPLAATRGTGDFLVGYAPDKQCYGIYAQYLVPEARAPFFRLCKPRKLGRPPAVAPGDRPCE